MTTVDLYRLAGVSSWIALIALVLSAIALALFFGGAGQFWGPVNDALVVVTAIALLPAVIAVARLAGERGAPWVTIVSVAAVAGLILIAVGQALLIVGVLSLEGSYVTGGLGVVPFLAWIVMVAVLALGAGVIPTTTGWLAVGILMGIVALSAIAVVTRGPVLWVGGIALLIAISAWLAGLATSFASNAATAAAASA
jgi:hypothetical protein